MALVEQFILLTAAILLCGCFDGAAATIYDLSHEHKPSTFVFEGYPSFNRTPFFKGLLPNNEYNIFIDNGYYVTSEHSGTHMDVPSHLYEGGKSMEQITVDMTIADGVLIDCSEEAKENQSYSVPVEKLEEWEREYGRIPDHSAVIINFGWSSKFEDHEAYRGSATSFDFPYISNEAGVWLANDRQAKIIAMDTFSPDSMNPADPQTFVIHKAMLGHNKLIVENLKDPGQLPPRGFRFFAVPVKYQGAPGTQVRAFAISFDDDFFNRANSGNWIKPSSAIFVLSATATAAVVMRMVGFE